MTNAEKIAKKTAALDDCLSAIRRTVMHNGADITVDSDIHAVAEHCAEADIDRATLVMQDIATIDYVRNTLLDFGWKTVGWVELEDGSKSYSYCKPNVGAFAELTTAEASALANNDPSVAVSEYTVGYKGHEELTSGTHKDWAVVKLTPTGAQIVSCGGGYYQAYIAEQVWADVEETTTDPDTGEETTTTVNSVVAIKYVQKGETGLLEKVLSKTDAAWTSGTWRAKLTGEEESYTEGGIDFWVVPCSLPGKLSQLVLIRYNRADENGEWLDSVKYSLTENSCDDTNEGMLALPLGCWLIYDNTTLASAPQALLVPKTLTDKSEKHVTGIEIVYSELASGMERLRLVSGAFGDEYIIATPDLKLGRGAWYE